MLVFKTELNWRGDVYPIIIQKDENSDYAEIQLNESILQVSRNFILTKLAELLYRDPYKWNLIAQANELKHPADWMAGDIVRIPIVGSIAIEEVKTKFIYA